MLITGRNILSILAVILKLLGNAAIASIVANMVTSQAQAAVSSWAGGAWCFIVASELVRSIRDWEKQEDDVIDDGPDTREPTERTPLLNQNANRAEGRF